MPKDSQEANFSDTKVQPAALERSEIKPDLFLEGDLNLSDYICDAPISQKTIDELAVFVAKEREETRTELVRYGVNN